ncbi:hypothetical protein U5801_23330 [Lamprobacter modestohalophilus]|uniref:hypothetical protein n=1 Tax=Lamprobacter modestohalophilus TaxID=1064514 RepID=UPI002ADED0E0|nr:hypothetical protein [Lamprobacter modestohalophilus]MEA1052720.1 hypothetical protein [Lamprobacter modestohalophilus]
MTRWRSVQSPLGVRLGAGLLLLFVVSPSLAAWGASAFYPTSVVPSMPEPERAQQLLAEPRGLIETLRAAHLQSARKGWMGVPGQPGSDLRHSGAAASGTSNSDR